MANAWDGRKKGLEEEYFRRKEREALEKTRQRLAAEEQGRRRVESVMRCPKCGEPLKERSFQKILIDQCTGCSGIWLDAGELEEVAGREEGGWLGRLWQKIG